MITEVSCNLCKKFHKTCAGDSTCRKNCEGGKWFEPRQVFEYFCKSCKKYFILYAGEKKRCFRCGSSDTTLYTEYPGD